MRPFRIILALLAMAALPAVAGAAPITITFEDLTEFDSVLNHYPGLAFTNATVLTAGSSLNEVDFPPHSGQNVVFDDGGPISVLFDNPVFSFGGFFNYSVPVTLTAFDTSHNPLGSATSQLSSNLGISPNEFLELILASGISSITITGDPAGGSFTLDDVTYSADPVPVPEPGTLTLLALGGLGLLRRRLTRRV
jgi:hypothetical protein